MGVVGDDGRAHFPAPGIRAEGIDVFVLGQPDRVIEGLAEVGEGRGGFWFDFPLCDGGEKAAQSGSEIAGGQISAGEEVGYVLSGLLGGAGLRFLARMEETEVRMAGAARSAAVAAIGKGERTQAGTVLGAISGHGSLQKRRIWVARGSRGRRGVLLNEHNLPES